jgi:regulator of protease activity HflC (stomatin/prohibitin superfamily)
MVSSALNEQTRRKDLMKRFLILSTVVVIALGCLSGCAKVDAGHGGVLWTAWSGTQEDTYTEGWYFVAPWNKMITYNVRLQDRSEELHVLANNGLSIRLETSVRYRVNLGTLPVLHQKVGQDYYDVLIAPSMRSAARKVVGRYTPEQIYSTKREEVELEALAAVVENLKDAISKKLEGATVDEDPIQIKAILVRNVDLPDKLKRAINDKLEEEQRSLKMKFTLSRERQEAERKEIEAKGIAKRNRIITESITDRLLSYEGIQATERLAKSSNSKTVVIGAGKQGLPLILGGQ